MGDELRTGLGGGIEGDANAVGNKDTSISHSVAGRDLVENNYYESPPPKLPADHPYKKYTLADVVAVLIGNDLTGDPGLVRRVIEIEKELAHIREERRSPQLTWFNIFMLVVLSISTIVMIVTLGVFFSGLLR